MTCNTSSIIRSLTALLFSAGLLLHSANEESSAKAPPICEGTCQVQGCETGGDVCNDFWCFFDGNGNGSHDPGEGGYVVLCTGEFPE